LHNRNSLFMFYCNRNAQTVTECIWFDDDDGYSSAVVRKRYMRSEFHGMHSTKSKQQKISLIKLEWFYFFLSSLEKSLILSKTKYLRLECRWEKVVHAFFCAAKTDIVTPTRCSINTHFFPSLLLHILFFLFLVKRGKKIIF
jgi:hypothetical protein